MRKLARWFIDWEDHPFVSGFAFGSIAGLFEFVLGGVFRMDAAQLIDSFSRLVIGLVALLGFCLAYKANKEVGDLKDEVYRLDGELDELAGGDDCACDGEERR